MLDLNDFITERGGDINKIKESQRRRFAPEEVVEEVIALYEAARRGMFCVDARIVGTVLTATSTVRGHSNRLRAQCRSEGDWKEEEGTEPPCFFLTQQILTLGDQAKEDASDLVNQKADIEKRKKEAEDIAAQKELERDRKIRPIGNYVHDSVPVSNNEVGSPVQNHRRQACFIMLI